MDQPEADAWITTGELLAHARRHDPNLSTARLERRLEQFRNQGLLPAARRIGQHGQQPVYGHPAETVKQLDALMLWRRQEKNPDRLRVLLWIDGWPIDVDKVRRSFAGVLRQMHVDATAALQDMAGTRRDPITAAARDLASRRGKNAVFPRRGRTPAATRAESVELLLRCFVGDTRPTINNQQAAAVLRLLGEDPARAAVNDISPHSTGATAEDLLPDPAVFGLEQLASMAASVTVDELLHARRDIKVIAVWLPIFAALTGSLTDGTGTAIDVAGLALDNPLVSVLLLAVVITLRRAGMTDTVAQLDDALQATPELLRQAETVEQMPSARLQRNLRSKPEAQRAVDRLLSSDSFRAVKDTAARQRRGKR
jgi:hypothetical protein